VVGCVGALVVIGRNIGSSIVYGRLATGTFAFPVMVNWGAAAGMSDFGPRGNHDDKIREEIRCSWERYRDEDV
jgi:hypothetical protein